MSIWSKLITAFRGGGNEIGVAIVDTQALRILDQEVRDSSEEMKNAKNSLAEMMAREKVAEQKCTTLKNKVVEFEGYAVQALQKDDEILAQELAEKIADFENQQSAETKLHSEFKESVDSLRKTIKQTESNITQLKHQLDTVRATENVQRAQAAVAKRYSGSNSKLTTAMDSLERIKEKQALKEAQFDAAQQLAEDDSLKDKLEEAGIVPGNLNGDAVLLRLKEKVTPRIGSDSRSRK